VVAGGTADEEVALARAIRAFGNIVVATLRRAMNGVSKHVRTARVRLSRCAALRLFTVKIGVTWPGLAGRQGGLAMGTELLSSIMTGTVIVHSY
jgi:hypothetical protein